MTKKAQVVAFRMYGVSNPIIYCKWLFIWWSL